MFTPSGDGSASDKRQAFRHTTHNAFVLCLFLSLDSGTRVNPTTRARSHLFEKTRDFRDC